MGGARNPGDGSTARRVRGGARRGPSKLPGGGIDNDYCAFPTCPGNPRGIVSAPALHFCTLLPPPPSPTLSASHRQRRERLSFCLPVCLAFFFSFLFLFLFLSASTSLGTFLLVLLSSLTAVGKPRRGLIRIVLSFLRMIVLEYIHEDYTRAIDNAFDS